LISIGQGVIPAEFAGINIPQVIYEHLLGGEGELKEVLSLIQYDDLARRESRTLFAQYKEGKKIGVFKLDLSTEEGNIEYPVIVDYEELEVELGKEEGELTMSDIREHLEDRIGDIFDRTDNVEELIARIDGQLERILGVEIDLEGVTDIEGLKAKLNELNVLTAHLGNVFERLGVETAVADDDNEANIAIELGNITQLIVKLDDETVIRITADGKTTPITLTPEATKEILAAKLYVTAQDIVGGDLEDTLEPIFETLYRTRKEKLSFVLPEGISAEEIVDSILRKDQIISTLYMARKSLWKALGITSETLDSIALLSSSRFTSELAKRLTISLNNGMGEAGRAIEVVFGKFDKAFELKESKLFLSFRTLAQLTREDIKAIREYVSTAVSTKFHFTASEETKDIMPMQLIMMPFAPEKPMSEVVAALTTVKDNVVSLEDLAKIENIELREMFEQALAELGHRRNLRNYGDVESLKKLLSVIWFEGKEVTIVKIAEELIVRIERLKELTDRLEELKKLREELAEKLKEAKGDEKAKLETEVEELKTEEINIRAQIDISELVRGYNVEDETKRVLSAERPQAMPRNPVILRRLIKVLERGMIYKLSESEVRAIVKQAGGIEWYQQAIRLSEIVDVEGIKITIGYMILADLKQNIRNFYFRYLT